MASAFDTRASIGVALVWSGVPLGMYLNFFFPTITWSPWVMAASILLIARYKNLFAGRLPAYHPMLLVVAAFQSFMLIYGAFSDTMTTQYASFHLYVIALVIALASNNRDQGDFSKVILWTFLISGLCTGLGAILLSQGLIVGETAWEMRQENSDYALEIFTVSNAALVNLATVIYFPRDTYRRLKWLAYPFCAICLYVILFGGKRTPLIIMLAIAAVFVIKRKKISPRNFVFGCVLSVPALSLAYFGSDTLRTKVNESVHNTVAGVSNILGDQEVSDNSGSAIIRYENREWAYEYISQKFSPVDYVVGGGYMVRWLDNPLLQSYLDMGVIGILGYLFLVILYPALFIIRRSLSDIELLSASLCLYNILSCISSGNPYMYSKYTPVTLLVFFAALSIGRRKHVASSRHSSLHQHA